VRRGEGDPACWGKDRHHGRKFFEDVFWGRSCDLNWYTGNQGALGQEGGGPAKEWVIPHFTRPAPALLGFDRNIDWHCHNEVDNGGMHAKKCVQANVNILSLYGDQIPYNVCRNVEWQTCAARGSLPGQGSNTIMFSFAPKDLQLRGGESPLGSCNSYAPQGCPYEGYASGDIFYMEVCWYDQLCSNRDELWALNAADPWHCEMNWRSYQELLEWILPTGKTFFDGG